MGHFNLFFILFYIRNNEYIFKKITVPRRGVISKAPLVIVSRLMLYRNHCLLLVIRDGPAENGGWGKLVAFFLEERPYLSSDSQGNP